MRNLIQIASIGVLAVALTACGKKKKKRKKKLKRRRKHRKEDLGKKTQE